MFFTVAVGYVKTRHDRIEMDPDLRIREAISLVFRKFAEFQSIRQVHLWLRQERIQLPAADGPRTVWKLPVYNTVHHMLTNPVYGGAYAFGRTGSRVTVRDGRKRVTSECRRARADWEVLIPEHHEGYISWAEFERNQQLIADNANSKGFMARGAVRRGESLLAGLLRCGHCGRRLHVAYSGTDGFCVRYNCRGAHLNHGTEPCISFGGIRVDAAVAAEVLRVLASLGIKAALRAIEARRSDAAERRRQTELALTQARYEAELARRQYDRIDPGPWQRAAVQPSRRGRTGAPLDRPPGGGLPPGGAAFGSGVGPGGAAEGGGTRPAPGPGRRYRSALASSRRNRGDAQAHRSDGHRGDRRQAGRGHDPACDPLARGRPYPPDGAEEPANIAGAPRPRRAI